MFFDRYDHHHVLTFLTRKLLSSVVAYVVKYIYICPLDANMCSSWWCCVLCCLSCSPICKHQ
jgi:hypothetical protein